MPVRDRLSAGDQRGEPVLEYGYRYLLACREKA